jgi:hypothetical protein
MIVFPSNRVAEHLNKCFHVGIVLYLAEQSR